MLSEFGPGITRAHAVEKPGEIRLVASEGRLLIKEAEIHFLAGGADDGLDDSRAPSTTEEGAAASSQAILTEVLLGLSALAAALLLCFWGSRPLSMLLLD